MLFFANFISALFFFFFTTTTTIIFQHVNYVAAAPISDVNAHKLIVFNPPITSPKASAAWAKGSVQTVQWGKSSQDIFWTPTYDYYSKTLLEFLTNTWATLACFS